MSKSIGQRVIVTTFRGYPGEEVPVEVEGVLAEVVASPWGLDVTVRLDPPAPVGNPTHEPTDRLSLSADSPNLRAVEVA